MTIRDEIMKLEEEGIRRTQVSDWSGAREFFERALTFDMPALRQAQILRNIAGTYLKEGNQQAVVRTVERAIAILDAAGVSAEQLRNELHNISTFSGGNLPLSTSLYVIVFLVGLYWGVSVASGAQMNPILIFLGPPILCFCIACVVVGGLSSRAVLGATTLYVNFLFSFGIGYVIANAGIIRFAY